MIRLGDARESRWALVVASFGFVGYAPWAPGTAGSVAAMVVMWLLRGLPVLGWVVLSAGLFAIGVMASERAAAIWGERDPGRVVVDEVVGYWIALLFVPLTPFFLITGLLLFRLFDIVKPLGIRKLEKLSGGLGIMADDAAAGLLANVCLQLIRLVG